MLPVRIWKILEDLWYGNINSHETFLDNNRYFKQLLSLMGKNRDKLIASFIDQQKELLENTTTRSTKGTPSPSKRHSSMAFPSALDGG